MARGRLIKTAQFPYHVVNRANNKEWFQLPLAQVWDLTLECLSAAHKKYPFTLHALVLMTNHYHLLLSTPDENIDKVMYEFNRRFSRELGMATKRINRMFGGRYKWSLLKENAHYLNVLRYIYQNPVRGGAVKACEEWRFSTLSYLCFKRTFPIPLSSPIALDLDDDKRALKWLNTIQTSEGQDAIRRGLKHINFKFSSVGPRALPLLDAEV